MTTVAEVLDLLEGWFPSAWAEEWDNPGLQVGNPSAPGDRILCALDPTLEVIQEAAGSGTSLVVTHHPLIFEPLTRVELDGPVGSVVGAAIAGGVCVVACHTNADVADPGVTDALASELGLRCDGPLAPVASGAPGLGRVSSFAGTFAELAERCREATGAAPRLIGAPAPDGPGLRVAMCGGSGASLIGAAFRSGCDVLITGDVKHHAALEARALGLSVIDAGHHGTEWPFVPALAERLCGVGLAGIVSQVNTDPFRERG